MSGPHHTGPELFSIANEHQDRWAALPAGDPLLDYRQGEATFHAMQANTAAFVMLAGVIANATGQRNADLEGWSKVIPSSPLPECWGLDARRPQCADWHTEDCPYSDPVVPAGTRVLRGERVGRVWGTVKEQKRLRSGRLRLRVAWDGAEISWISQDSVEIVRHERLPIGTRVLFHDNLIRYEHKTVVEGHPHAGKIVGHSANGCYKIAREYGGTYMENAPDYVFMDERVQVHPEGPEPLSARK